MSLRTLAVETEGPLSTRCMVQMPYLKLGYSKKVRFLGLFYYMK